MSDNEEVSDNESVDPQPWTPEGAQRLRAAADTLADAVREHAERLTTMRSDAGFLAVGAAGEPLLAAAVAYADAQFEYTGNGFPLGGLGVDEEEDQDDGTHADV